MYFVYVFTFLYHSLYEIHDYKSLVDAKCSLRDNQVLFHMTRQKHTIKINCKGHPLINVNKKVDFKSLNFNNHHAI